MNFLADAISRLNFIRKTLSQPSGTPLVRQLCMRLGFTSSFSANRVTPPQAKIATSKEFMPVYITFVGLCVIKKNYEQINIDKNIVEINFAVVTNVCKIAPCPELLGVF